MHRSAHQAALEQANLLAAYLAETPSTSLDLRFIRRHLDDLDSFAEAASVCRSVAAWDDQPAAQVEADRSGVDNRH